MQHVHTHKRTHAHTIKMSNNFAMSPVTVPKSCVPLRQCWYSLLPDGPSSALTQSVDISDSVSMTQISPPSLQQPTTGMRSEKHLTVSSTSPTIQSCPFFFVYFFLFILFLSFFLNICSFHFDCLAFSGNSHSFWLPLFLLPTVSHLHPLFFF